MANNAGPETQLVTMNALERPLMLRTNRCRSMVGKQLRKFRSQALAQIGADVDGDREGSFEFPVIRNTGIDEDKVVKMAGEEERIALGGPGLLNDVDVGERIESRAHRPQHLIKISGIDVLVDHHGPLAGVSAALAGGCDVQRLARVARITLAELDRGKAGSGPGFVIPYPEHLRHAASLERAPDLRRSGDPLQQAGFVDRLVLRRAGK